MEEVGVVGCTFTDSFIVPLRALARPWFFPLWVFHVNLGVHLSGCCVFVLCATVFSCHRFPQQVVSEHGCGILHGEREVNSRRCKSWAEAIRWAKQLYIVATEDEEYHNIAKLTWLAQDSWPNAWLLSLRGSHDLILTWPAREFNLTCACLTIPNHLTSAQILFS